MRINHRSLPGEAEKPQKKCETKSMDNSFEILIEIIKILGLDASNEKLLKAYLCSSRNSKNR